jgi:glycosyltransferase involved in cell wall biosynthesis
VTIAFLLDGFGVGGTELNAVRTLESFARQGVSVNVLHFHADGPLRSRVERSGHQMVHVPIVSLSSPRIALRITALAAALNRLDADLLHTQDVYTNILGVAAGRYIRRIPVLTSRRWKDDVPRPGLTRLNAFAHRHSTLVLPNSPALVATLRAERVDPSRIAVHENFVDDHALTLLSPSERATWRASLGIPVDAPVVGCVARLSRVKRHDVLIRAFATAALRAPDARLVLVGDGDERRAISELCSALGIERQVIFTGTIPNYPLAQQLFDVAVLTSENEGFPNSLVEASACGVAIVATPVGGVVDVLDEGVTGLTVPIGGVEATAAAVSTLLLDPGLRSRMGLAGRALVTDRYSESAAMTRLTGIYARARASAR